MSDSKITRKHLKEIQRNLKTCRKWLHQTFEQPYTVEEMTKTLAYYLNAHLHYYSNLPGQVAEKQQRIFKIQDRLIADHSNRTRDLKIALATSSDKKSLLRGEIAKYDHPYLYYKQGQYYKNEFTMVIPHVIDMLAEGHSPYFEFVFDENLELKNRDVYDFFSDLYFLEFLRQELADIENKEKAELSGYPPLYQYNSFEDLFEVNEDFKKVVDYLKSINVLNENGAFINKSGNKKYLAILPHVLRKKPRMRPFSDIEAASLMKGQFKMQSLSTDYLSKDFPNRAELVEEMVKCLRF